MASNTTGELVYFADNTFNKIRRVVSVSCSSSIPQTPIVTITQPTTSIPTGSITITSPLGAFQYSIDNINYQGGTIFNSVSPGTYQITARKIGSEVCVSLSNNVTINNSSSQTTNGMISAGGNHSLFRCSDNTAMSVGNNGVGQLGDGTNTKRTTTVLVSSLSGITAIAGGHEHSLFLKNDGTVWACGSNFFGQLGDGTNTNRKTPVQVSSLSGITAIAGGEGHSLFLKNDGTVWACGRNYGNLGDGTNTDRKTPVQVSSLTGIIAIAVGKVHSLFLKNDGTVWACGSNAFGQLGNGTTTTKTTPVQVSGLSGITSIAAGYYHSMFVKSGGSVWICGDNAYGKLGIGSSVYSVLTPVQVPGLIGITAISGGYHHSLFLKNDNTAWACGYNAFGALGDGTTTDKSYPIQVSSLSGISSIAAGFGHSLFIKNNGTVWSCGENNYGQLGNETTNTNSNYPLQVTGLCNTLDIEENLKQNSVLVYPNPSKGIIYLELIDVKETELTLYNAVGQKILTKKINEKNSKLDLNLFDNGVYFLNFKNNNGASVKKIILDK